MKPVPIHKAKSTLSRLVARACAGEEVIIARGKRPIVKLVPVDSVEPRRKFGALRGSVVIEDAFFDALPDEEIAAWGG